MQLFLLFAVAGLVEGMYPGLSLQGGTQPLRARPQTPAPKQPHALRSRSSGNMVDLPQPSVGDPCDFDTSLDAEHCCDISDGNMNENGKLQGIIEEGPQKMSRFFVFIPQFLTRIIFIVVAAHRRRLLFCSVLLILCLFV